MSTVTEADRQAAHTVAISGGCFPALWNGAHSVVCDDITLAIATARDAGERAVAERERLDMNDETLVAEIAFDIGQATKTQPTMDGRCRRLHGDAENRRIARAAIRAINRLDAIAARRRP